MSHAQYSTAVVGLESELESEMEYIMDTNIASFVLDGELWEREPATLMRVRSELIPAYHQASENLKQVPTYYEPLRRSIVAFQWFKASKPTLLLPMTVQTELSMAQQVSANT